MPAFQDLTGMKFGRLTVVDRAEDRVSPSGHHYARWNCICECGNTTIAYASSLRCGGTVSCGCKNHEKGPGLHGFKDLMGMRFGRLTVIERADDYVQGSGRRRVRWRCKCDCGNETIVTADSLTGGHTISCGCYHMERITESNSTHHESNTPLYAVWNGMKSRCYNPNSTFYNYYGGRGICICDDWKNSYVKFRDWALENGYDSGLSIDRINVDGNYCPENCRWIDCVAQANNRRSNRIFTFNGETHNLKEWSNILGINYKKLHRRISSGWNFERAILTQ